jgi:subtilisin family serine protease
MLAVNPHCIQRQGKHTMLRARLAFLLVTLASLAVISPAAAAPRADDPGLAATGEVLVGYTDASSEGARDRAAGRVSPVAVEKVARGRGRGGPVELLELPGGVSNSDAIAALGSDPAVAYAEPNWIVRKAVTSNDPYFTNGSLWGMGGGFGSQASTAWGSGHTGSSSVYVGVIDEGIQYSHPDLDGNVANPGETVNGLDDDGNGYVDDRYGWDFANGDNTVYDGGSRGRLDDHGTHVSGTIGGEGGNGTGVAGVNWDVGLLSGKFLGRNGGTTADAVRAVDYFTTLKQRGLPIVATNNSWGGGGYSQALYDAIARANAADILFVAAAGNSGTNNDTTASYPSNYELPNVIAVAAIDRNGALASFSQYGRTTVDLGAPGVGVWSTTAFSNYSSYNGTSMATPHVTGAAALYKASNPTATALQVKEAILGAATPTSSLTGKTVTGGRLNAGGF